MDAAIDAVVSDLDGTLLDTEPLYAEAAQQMINKYGNGKKYDYDVRSKVIGKPEIVGAQTIVEAYNLSIDPQTYLDRRNEVLKDLFPTTPLLPGAKDVISHLKNNCKLPIGVATSSHKFHLDIKLTLHKDWFKNHVDVVIAGDDPRIKSGKPSPDIYLIAAKELNIAPERCLAFEDAMSGVLAAKRAGMKVIAIPDPNLDKTEFEEHAHIVLDSLQDFKPEEFGLIPFTHKVK